ncbi:MAG: EFR1 family ferrodoxin [Treponema sp.]|nr:EFR1 family ferrodoxin [Treponema sp.]
MNENSIFFFSGTGNSFDVALRTAGEIKNTDIINIASIKNAPSVDNYKRIGLVFPVYGFTAPNIVSKFISNLSKNCNAYYFCIVTLGGLGLGAEYRIYEKFKEIGVELGYIAHIYMPENYIITSIVTTDKILNKTLKDSVKSVKRISGDLINYTKKKPKRSIFYNMVEKISSEETKRWPLRAKDFVVNENCIKCKKCITICPVENIGMIDGEIAFETHCECCLACMHSCPNGAINYKTKTVGKKRYINPNIKIEEMKKYSL